MGSSTDDKALPILPISSDSNETKGAGYGYAELRCKSSFSFLEGASPPDDLVARAAELGLRALALSDRNGVYGLPRAYVAKPIAEQAGMKLIFGSELTLESPSGPAARHLTLLARDRAAYGTLCRMITEAHRDRPKGEPLLAWETFTRLASLPAARGLVALASLPEPEDSGARAWGHLRDLFPADRLHLALHRVLDGLDSARTAEAIHVRLRYGIPIVATNDVHYATAAQRPLQDALTALRHKTTVEQAGFRLFQNAERRLKSPAEMTRLFADLPEAVQATLEIAESCRFCPSELRYRYPSEWIPAGETAQTYLARLVREGVLRRYPDGAPAEVRRQLDHELALIESLGYADYFLTIWEIVEFARSRAILCQGRGAAANSAVCYVLGITAIDPVKMNLLFERFLSVERKEPPDIDVDFEHERREEVLQHVYEKYGRDRAAMVANVICYRERLAVREAAKALGLPPETPAESDSRLARLASGLEGLPRHLGIHSGGFTLSADPIIETVPVEPARMEGRTIIQWDKNDLDSIGLLKVDLLSLGMLSALRKTLDSVNGSRPGAPLTLATIPPDDPATYEMIRAADTVGTFQIESRAQMSMLPRLLPRHFYDLVVQVAIVRPGPIQGGMVHPYLKRRRGEEPIDVPHPKLEPILGKTLGVPLFQEQVMQMAIALAGFTPGEADRLRRAIGAWRSSGSIHEVAARLRDGLRASGLPESFIERIFRQIQGFAEYGFPESHAASFALLAYASAYLKRHHPAEFLAALINSQPMGFYSTRTLVNDAVRHGVEVRPVCPLRSGWDCALEAGSPGAPAAGPAVRLGFRRVSGLAEADGQTILKARAERPFADLGDFLARTRIRSPAVLYRLAMGDAFACFGLSARDALWEILSQELLARPEPAGQLSLFAFAASAPGRRLTAADSASENPGLFALPNRWQEIHSDYAAYGASTRGHPMEPLRKLLPDKLPSTDSRRARSLAPGRHVRVAGLMIVRQHPPTAKSVTFGTLEDEHGFIDLVFWADVWERCRETVLENPFLIVSGTLQRDGQAVSLLVRSVSALADPDPPAGAESGSRPEAEYRDMMGPQRGRRSR